MSKKFTVAIPCSGLGHIKRGIETWTVDLAKALDERQIDVTVFKGFGDPDHPWEKVIPCVRRDSDFTKKLMRLRPGFMWRFGLASPYTFEQLTFNLRLWPALIKGQFDIIHTQDPQIAEFCQKLSQWNIIRSKVILAHGTEEPFKFLNQFKYLQHLAPFHRDEMEGSGFQSPKMFAIGNFIDTQKFQPRQQSGLRDELNIPNDAFVVTSVAAIKRTHKRMDHLIEECAKIDDPKLHVLVAGSKGEETDDIIRLGQEKLGKRVTFLTDFPHHRVPEIHNASDVYVLCSLKDMMPIALIEALSSGLPAITHTYPVEAWMIGDGGDAIDMSRSGVLAETIRRYMNDNSYRQDRKTAARKEAEIRFARDVIMDEIMKMYDQVLSDE